METIDYTLVSLTIILLLGLVVPELVKKLKIPFVTTLILLGAILGPNQLGWVETNEIINFFGFLGFTFIMLMAGLETETDTLKKELKHVAVMALINGGIPFLMGFGIALVFGYGMTTALIVGTIFISSSVAIIIPALKSSKIFKTEQGQKIAAAVILQDMISLVILAVIFHQFSPSTPLPLYAYLLILLLATSAVIVILPRLTTFFIKRNFWGKKKPENESELRFIIVLLISVLMFFSLLGVHPILAAFLVGLLLSHVPTSRLIDDKFHTLGYGLFVPVFFFIIGMEMDFSVFTDNSGTNAYLLGAIISGGILAKFVSGYVGGRLGKLDKKNAEIFGIVSTTQLTTTLAATYTASNAGLLDATWLTAILVLSIITTVLIPVILQYFTSIKPSKKWGGFGNS